MSRRKDTVVAAVSAVLERALVRDDSSILAGVSGGADSVALLHVLLELRGELRIVVSAAHLNHRIRGAEADRDEAFVRELCRRLGVKLVCERAKSLDASMPNLEERAREARLEFLQRTAAKTRADYIALAHHADDQAETVLMRLLRGAGVAGLAAMSDEAGGKIIRPMLSVTRKEIRRYIRKHKIEFVEDSTNTSPAILRNRIRHELLPILEREYAPGLSERLVGLGTEMRDLDAFLSRLAKAELDAISIADDAIDVERFCQLDPALRRAVLRAFVARIVGTLRRMNREHIESIDRLALGSGPNAVLDLPGGWRARREYTHLKLERGADEVVEEYKVPLDLEGETLIRQADFTFRSQVEESKGSRMPASLNEAIFDVDAIAGQQIVARNFRAGDRIAPLGIRGHRKLKEVFIDRKVPVARRAIWPLVTSGDEILWVPGLIRSRVALVSKSTRALLRVEARAYDNV
jgi:tRNA(Ile)-lysidine synthase